MHNSPPNFRWRKHVAIIIVQCANRVSTINYYIIPPKYLYIYIHTWQYLSLFHFSFIRILHLLSFLQTNAMNGTLNNISTIIDNDNNNNNNNNNNHAQSMMNEKQQQQILISILIGSIIFFCFLLLLTKFLCVSKFVTSLAKKN